MERWVISMGLSGLTASRWFRKRRSSSPTGRLEEMIGSADGLDARWYGPVSADQTKLTTPVILKLELKNRTGRDLKLPTEFVRNEPNVVSLTRGMVLTVDRAPPDLLYFQRDRPKPVWEPVTPKSQSPFVPEAAQATRTLNPAESFEAFAVDLNNLFDLKAPGLYRVTLLFTKDSGITEGTLTPRIFNLPIKPEGGRSSVSDGSNVI